MTAAVILSNAAVVNVSKYIAVGQIEVGCSFALVLTNWQTTRRFEEDLF